MTEAVRAFVTKYPEALLLEDGRAIFDLRRAQLRVSAEHGRCALHLWSEDRNLVRRVLGVAVRPGGVLRLSVQRMGQARPQMLELVSEGKRRTPSTRELTRRRYLGLLERVLARAFPDERPEGLRTAMDLERSFGPAYARGVLRRGRECWAVIAVNGAESQATVDGVLTLGVLWLAQLREQASGRRLFQGLRLVLPTGMAATTRARLAWMDAKIARYELFGLDERTEELERLDAADNGNLATRLLDAPNQVTAVAPDGRFAEAIARVLALVPPGTRVLGRWGSEALERVGGDVGSAHKNTARIDADGPVAELRLRSAGELAFLVHGLEFARARAGYVGQSFNRHIAVTVGSGAQETALTADTEATLRERVWALFARRRASGDLRDVLFRSAPESWLASVLRGRLPEIDAALAAEPVYTEVAAMTGGGRSLDRGMLDLLGVTRDRRLAVIEIKAAEDLQMALQGLDYWIRVRHHHLGNVDAATGLGELQQSGYFPEVRLAAEPPLLLLVAPALDIHPATETVLRHLDPRVEWTLVALDQRWRSRVRVVWRRRSGDGLRAISPTGS